MYSYSIQLCDLEEIKYVKEYYKDLITTIKFKSKLKKNIVYSY